MTSRHAARHPVWAALSAAQHAAVHRVVATARATTMIRAIIAARFRPDNSGVVLVEQHDGQLRLWGITQCQHILPVQPDTDAAISRFLRAPHETVVPGSTCTIKLHATTLELQVVVPESTPRHYTVALPREVRYMVQ